MKKAHVHHVRITPDVKISRELADKLHRIAFSAYKRSHKGLAGEDLDEKEVWIHTATTLAVEQAIAHYISEKYHEIPPPDFRQAVKTEGRGESAIAKAVKKLQDAIQGLQGVLPKEDPLELTQALNPPPFEQMRALYCYDDTESDGLDNDGDEAEKREDLWDIRFSPAAVQETLKLWLNLMETLHRRAGMGAAPASAKVDFVHELAKFWTTDIGGRLVNSRTQPSYKEGAKGFKEGSLHGQQGLFAEFVRAAAKGIPPDFPRTAWDAPIRRVTERKD